MRTPSEVSIDDVLDACCSDPACFRCGAPMPPRRGAVSDAEGGGGWAVVAQITGGGGAAVRVQGEALCCSCAEDLVTFLEGKDPAEPPVRTANQNGDVINLTPTGDTFEGIPVYTDHKSKGQ